MQGGGQSLAATMQIVQHSIHTELDLAFISDKEATLFKDDNPLPTLKKRNRR